jgi:hypothetical protein
MNSPKKLNTEEIIKLISILKLYPAFNTYMLINILIPCIIFFMLLSLKYDISICITKRDKKNKSKIGSSASIDSDSKSPWLNSFYTEKGNEKGNGQPDESKTDEYRTIWEQYATKK